MTRGGPCVFVAVVTIVLLQIGGASARACVFFHEDAPKTMEKSKMGVTDSSSCFMDSSSSLVTHVPRERKNPGSASILFFLIYL